ncbi:MAG: NrfD/PsrC family molybdoenzyme membrane anchor subunit, partial [Candidatus Binatia bacterium]
KWSHNAFVPLYLFFGGLAAGMFIVAVATDIAGVWSRRALAASRIVAYGVLPILILAGFFLTIHLGKPERGLLFPIFFTNYNSWMTRGGWILGVSAILMVLYAVLWFFGTGWTLRRIIGLVGLIPAVGLALYTGLLLSGSGYVPLWSREYLPPLFLTSGLNTGLAAAGLLAFFAWPWLGPSGLSPRPVIRWFGIVLMALILFEGWELYRFMRHLSSQGLLTGHESAATTERFQYKVEPGGSLGSGSYVAVVTWVGNATGVEEGMSADTPIQLSQPNSQVIIVAPRKPGVTYNVYFGPSHAEARKVAANIAPKESVAIQNLSRRGFNLPLNIQTGGEFLAPSGGRLAYRYLTGGPDYPRALFRGTAEAALSGAVSVPPNPTVFHDLPHGRSLAGWFWFGVVGLALVIPIALTLVEFVAELGGRAIANGVAAVKFASVLAGGLILRFVIAWGGDIKAPLSFTPSTWPIPFPPPGLGG